MSQALKNKYSGLITGLKLRAPALPGAAPSPEPAPARYPVFQELAAERQDFQDGFSRFQLGLLELRNQAGAETPASDHGSMVGPAPAAAPVVSGSPAEFRAFPEPPAPAGLPAVLRRRLPAVLAAAAVLAGLFGLFLMLNSEADEAFSLPPSRAAGLCLDGSLENLLFVDPKRQLLITVSVRERRVRAMRSFPGDGVKAIAYDGEKFWSTDGKRLYKHASSGGYPVVEVYAAGQDINALCWDGKKLWAATDDGKLVRYGNTEKPSVAAVHNLETVRSPLIYASGGKILVLDTEQGTLRSFQLDGGMKTVFQANIKSLLPKGRIAGFAVSGMQVWVITDNPAELTAIKLEGLEP